MPRLIAITGVAESGKSTVANMLVAQHGFKVLKFAEPIKKMLEIIGLSREDMEKAEKKGLSNKLLCGKSPRYAMQTLGTEWGRMLIHENLWAEIWKRQVKQLLLDGSPVICDDLRFQNEVEVVKDLGGEIWAIRRKKNTMLIPHASEMGLAMRYADWNISNNGSINDLLMQIADRIGRT